MDGYSRAVRLWQSYRIASAADMDKYLHSFRILFAYHSGKIENEEITYHDTWEIFENGRVTGYTGSPAASPIDCPRRGEGKVLRGPANVRRSGGCSPSVRVFQI